MPEKNKIKISELKPNPDNPRRISKDKLESLKKSLTEFPAMMELRPIIIDHKNTVLGGNMRLKALKELGYKEIPDGWVKKATELTEDEKRRFVITDNVGFGEWDYELLAQGWDAVELDGWGVDVPVWEAEPEEAEEDKYTRKITAPIYEISNEMPKIEILVDNNKTNELIKEIKKTNISMLDKEFLIKASQRHLVFDYSKIADYYAHSSKEVQELMEKNGLVIIDFDKAIENGFVQLSKDIAELAGLDNDEE